MARRKELARKAGGQARSRPGKTRRGKTNKRRQPSGYNTALDDYTAALESMRQALALSRAGKTPGDQVGLDSRWTVMAENDDAKWVTQVDDTTYQQRAEYSMEKLQNARIFVIAPEQFGAWHRAADVYTTEEIAGLEYHSLEMDLQKYQLSDADIERHIKKIVTAGLHVPFPDPKRWPFQTLWFGYRDKYGTAMALNHRQLQLRLGEEPPFPDYHCVGGRAIGHLVAMAGDGTGPVMLELVEGMYVPEEYIELMHQSPAMALANMHNVQEQRAFLWDTVFSNGEWHTPYTLMPWITTALFAYLAEFRTFVLEQTFARKTPKVPAKTIPAGNRPVPPPYYLIKLQPHVINSEARQRMVPRRTWRLQHRTDVMGHERVRIQRGTRPIAPELLTTLQHRGYRVYDGSMLKPYDVPRLAERGVALPRQHEWLAIKVSWVTDHQRGPADSHYVPALRVPS